MELRFECTACGQHISATPDQIGFKAPCPSCGAPIVVPNPLAASTKQSPLPLVSAPGIPSAVPSAPPVLPFAWWPRSRAGATFSAVALVFVFLAAIGGGIFGSLFAVGFVFLSISGIRYVFYRLRPHSVNCALDAVPATPAPLWRHPVTIGIAICCVLFLFIAIKSSSDSTSSQQQYAAAIQQNKAAYDEYNSTGANVGRAVEAFGRGFVGDIKGGFEIDDQVKAQNREFAERDAQLRAGYSAAASSGSDAGAVIGAVILIFVALAAFVFFQRYKSRRRKNAST